MTLRLHGIPNCDTVKRARAWLTGQGLAHDFVDFKKAGASAADLQRWADAVGWERLLNRQGTTWRRLDPALQAEVVDAASALRLMQAQTSTIKRPVIEWPDGAVTVGFSPEAWGARCAAVTAR
ncbi:arsenate reductase [Ideonella sp.]|uniref:arsenate reductase n=1 Tax=Ideonella sp. TaxID=1929293 RepID=UPI002B4A241D|nr:arsenate reductase [Ideonella sp.]HJV69130.1 arsenate reductase [Ideonella sp.]